MDTNPTGAHCGHLVRSRHHSEAKQSREQSGKTNHPRDGEWSFVEKIANDRPDRGSSIEKSADTVKEVDNDIERRNADQARKEDAQKRLDQIAIENATHRQKGDLVSNFHAVISSVSLSA